MIVRNLTGAPQSVTITVEYPGEKGPQQSVLAPLALGPYSSQDISVDSAFGLLPLPLPYCSIRIQYSGPPGSAIAEVSSIEARGDLVIDSRLANEGDGWAGSGAHPWHLDAETESVLFLTNMGAKSARVGFQVQAGGIHYYLTDLKLAPHETRAIDLRRLRDAQKDDFQGNKIPAGASDGSVLWVRLDNVPVMGRLIVLSRHKGIASNYDCASGPCPAGYKQLSISPSPARISVGNYQQFDALETFVDSNGTHIYYVTLDSTWCTSDATVASVSSTYKGRVKGEKYGSATITATYTDVVYRWNNLECICDEIFVTRSRNAPVDVDYGCGTHADERNNMTQEYHDYKTSDTNPFYPVCGDFTQSASTTHFTFAMLHVHDPYSWAILRQVFLTGLENTRVAYNQDMTVNSGYRSPKHNQSVSPGIYGSRHVFGDAADIASNQTTWQTMRGGAWANGACVEPSDYGHPGVYDYGHVHMDWRGTCPSGWGQP